MKDLIKKLNQLQNDLETLIAEREEQFENHSEKWQESEKGESFQELTDKAQELLDAINDFLDFQ